MPSKLIDFFCNNKPTFNLGNKEGKKEFSEYCLKHLDELKTVIDVLLCHARAGAE